ncbi:proteoglycan 4 [Acrasis kona]|uniref:Proteoglycan 4 n=1 Tax=Acrasis kona TaxID=1008807 RepID=A0AAW2Z8V8_9EUKA
MTRPRVVLCLLVALATHSLTLTTTSFVSKNVAILTANAKENFAGAGSIVLGTGRFGLYAYPLNNIPTGCTISKATLQFPASISSATDIPFTGAVTVSITKIIYSEPVWDLYTVTYDTRPRTEVVVIGGIKFYDNTGTKLDPPAPVDLTSSISASYASGDTEWGFMASFVSTNVITVPSSESGKPSYLSITYSCGESPSSPTPSPIPTSSEPITTPNPSSPPPVGSPTPSPTGPTSPSPSTPSPTTPSPTTPTTPVPSDQHTPTPTFTGTPEPTRNDTKPYVFFNVAPDQPNELLVFILLTLIRALVVGASIILLILCILNRGSNFMISRGFIPYSFLTWKILSILIEETQSVPSSWIAGMHLLDVSNAYSQIECYLTIYVINPFLILNVVGILITFYHFYSKRRTNKLLYLQTQNGPVRGVVEEPNALTNVMYRILKLTSTKLFKGIAIAVVVLAVYAVCVSQSAAYQGQCKFTDIAFYFQIVLILLVGLTMITMSSIDLLYMCFNKQKSSTLMLTIKNILFDDDPLMFRLENYMMGVAIFNYAVIRFVLQTYQLTSEINRQKTLVNVHLTLYILQFIFWDILGLVALPGVLHMAAIRFSRVAQMSAQQNMYTPIEAFSGFSFESSEETIHLLMGHPRTHDLMRDFACKEFSLENVMIYDEVKRYQIFEDVEQRAIHARLIINLYLLANSEFQVNLDKRRIEPVLTAAEAYKQDPHLNPLPQNLFEDIMRSVVENLLDTYDRFFFYTPFQDYIRKANNHDASDNYKL